MSHIPVSPQALTRVRSDMPPTVQPDRRASESARATFAASLATARADRAPVPSTPAHATPTTREFTRDVARDTARTDRAPARHDDDGGVRGSSSAQQRASVQALMLSGAMKYAVTRKEAPDTAPMHDPVSSQPAIADAPVEVTPSSPATTDAATLATLITDPSAAPTDTSATLPVALPPLAAEASQSPDIALTMPAGSAVQSMPAMIAIPADQAEPAPAAMTDASVDLSASNAAVAAALQLVAQLPIPVLTATQPPVQDLPSDSRFTALSSDTAMTATGSDAVSQQPTQSEPVLVEDHFDAPAVAMAAAATSSSGIAAASTMQTSELATSELATSELATNAASITPADATPAAPVTAPSAAAANAAAATAAAAPTAGRTDVTAMQADMAALDPAFRDRLEKVIDRMRDEFGHAVKVVETVRSQARQDALFAQGRTAPGPIVTWTKNSKHGKGLAADLVVDGSWQNPAGYAQLAAVARQEGLRTLGARDPGHVELPADGAVSGETLGNLLNDLQGDAGDAARQMRADVNSGGRSDARASMMAQVANVAQVARVASVAQVAKVAAVARPGAMPAQPAGGDNISPLAVTGASNIAASSDAASVMRVATPTTAVNMADRISHLMDLQATQDAKPLNSVLLRMDNANGIEDQIRIDTRGTNVDARLGLGNAQQAAAFTDRLGELREALERRGLSADGVRVQAGATRTADTVTLSKPAAQTIELAAMRAAADSQANGNTRDQSSRDQQLQREALARDTARHTPRSSSDDPRHRSRREQPEDRR